MERIQSAGPQVRVELRTENGEPLVVEIGHAQFRDASVGLGDWVFVSVRDARIFTEDYSI